MIGPGDSASSDDDIPLAFVKDANAGHGSSSIFSYSPTKDHRHFRVRCMAFQSIDGYNVFEPKVVSSGFNVVYPPLPMEQEPGPFPIDQYDNNIEVVLTFYANPTPNNENLVWHVVKPTSNLSLLVS